MRILLVFDGALDLVWSDELLMSSLKNNVRVDLDEDEDDNLEALDDVVGGDDVLEVDQDTLGWQLQQSYEYCVWNIENMRFNLLS